MFKILEQETIAQSNVPMFVSTSEDWQSWLAAGFVQMERHGSKVTFRIIDRESLRGIFRQKFPGEATDDGSAVDNVRAFGDSKARARESQNVCLLRGWQTATINGHPVDLGKMTEQFGLFATVLASLDTERACLVENLDSFRQAEQVLGKDRVYLHTYGRVGHEWLKKIQCREMLVFSDYDYVGLDEFLRVQRQFPHAHFFMPAEYEALWGSYAKSLKRRDEGEQRPSRLVSESNHPLVVAIREQLLRTGKFLEQQALFI